MIFRLFFNLSRVMTFYSLLENLIRQKQTNINTNNYVQYMTSQKTETSQLATQLLIQNIIHLSALHIYIDGVAQLLSTLHKHTTLFSTHLKRISKRFAPSLICFKSFSLYKNKHKQIVLTVLAKNYVNFKIYKLKFFPRNPHS